MIDDITTLDKFPDAFAETIYACDVLELLERAGFTDVQEYAHEPHPFGVTDASLANEPFGEFVSLNVRAVRV